MHPNTRYEPHDKPRHPGSFAEANLSQSLRHHVSDWDPVSRCVLRVFLTLEEAEDAQRLGDASHAQELGLAADRLLARLETFTVAHLEVGPLLPLPQECARPLAREITATTSSLIRAEVYHAVETTGRLGARRCPTSAGQAKQRYLELLSRAFEDVYARRDPLKPRT